MMDATPEANAFNIEKNFLTKPSDLTKTGDVTRANGDEALFPKSSLKAKQRYTVLKELGEGGMGVVQLVRDELLGREVALKKLHVKKGIVQKKEKQLLWRLQREAEIMAVLEHPNIVPLYEIQTKEEGELQFTMKKVEGKTLRHLFEQAEDNRSDERKFLEIFLKVCDGMRYAHSKGIIHRDLKPENIMIGNYGEVYILDWGIAKKITESSEEASSIVIKSSKETHETYKTFGGIGTIGYMPLEQQKSAAEVNERSDIYALGKILKECYTKLSPWQELKLFQNYLKNIQDKKEVPKKTIAEERELKISEEMRAIIEKATAKISSNRYESVEALSQDIKKYLKDIPISVKEYRFDELLQKWAKRHRKGITVFIYLFILAMIMMGALKWKNENNYKKTQAEAEESQLQAEALKELDKRTQEEQKTKLFLKALVLTNQALSYKPGKYESEVLKVNIVKKLLPICYEQEDYQLASFITDDLQTLVHFPEQKKVFSAQVEEKKIESLKQHLARLKEWEKKYKASEKKDQIEDGERDDFIFEVSKMREEEILQQLFILLQEGTQFFISEKQVSPLEICFYQDIAKVIGRLGNKKAIEKLRNNLILLWEKFLLFEAKNQESIFKELKRGSIPEFILQKLKYLLKQKGHDPEKKYHLKRIISNHRWEYIDEKEESFFIIDISQLENTILRIYDTRKKTNTEYSKFIKELVISLCYLEDHESIPLIFDIKDNPELFFTIDAPLKKLLQNFFQHLPEKTPDYVQRGLIYVHLKNFDEAIKNYTEAIRLSPQEAGIYIQRGGAKKEKKDLESALLDYTEAIRLNPKISEAYNNRGLVKSEKRDLDGAMLDYNEALHLNPQSAGIYINRGLLKKEKKDLDGAILDLTEAIRLNPQLPGIYNNLGILKAEKKDFDGAILDFDQALRLDPQFTEAYGNRGNVKLEQKDFDGAILDFDAVLHQNPQFERAHYNRGLIKYEKKDFDGAILDFDEALHQNPQFAYAYHNRGNVKYEKKDLDGAILDFNEALRLNPQFTEAYNNRGNAKSDQKDFESAIQDFNEALRINPQYIEAYYNRGSAKKAKNDLDGAIQDFNEALRLNPQYTDAYYNRGGAKSAKKDLEGAIQDFNEVLRLDPKFEGAYYNRGSTKAEKKDFDGAILDFDQALSLNPQFEIAYYNRGNAKKAKNDFDGAILDYNEVLRLNPQLVEAYNNRGVAKKEKKDFDGAILDFDQALSLNPQFVYAYYNRGFTKFEKKDFEGAIPDLDEAIRLNPQYTEAYYNRALAKHQKKAVEEAIQDMESAFSLDNHPGIRRWILEWLKQQSREQFSKKDWKNAKETLLKLKKYLPSDDPQQKQIDQKMQQLEQLLEPEEKK